MTSISKEEVLKIAGISNISVSEKEIELLQKELEAVLSYAERVSNIIGDAPETQLVPFNIFRPDTALGSDTNMLLQNSPDAANNYFVVPLIIDQ